MKTMKLVLRYGLCLAVGVVFMGWSNAQGETLQDAIQQMLKTNPDIRSTAYNKMAREQEVIQAKAR